MLNDLPTHITLSILSQLTPEDLKRLNQALKNEDGTENTKYNYATHLIELSLQKTYQNIIKLLNKRFFFADFIHKFAVYHIDPITEDLSKKPLFSNYDNNDCSISELDSPKNLGFGWLDLNQLKNSFFKTQFSDQIQLVFKSIKLNNMYKRREKELYIEGPEDSYYFICCKSEYEKSKKKKTMTDTDKNQFYQDNTIEKGKAPCEILAYKLYKSGHRDVTLRTKKAIFVAVCGKTFVVISSINQSTRTGGMHKLIQAGMELAERC